MGLLDDAIRDHLELKRRRGADPGEVAREEREALDPVVVADPDAWDGQSESEEDGLAVTGAPDHESNPAPPDEDHPTETHFQLPANEDPALATGQETAELDMEGVLAEDVQKVAGGNDELRRDTAGDLPLEWEAPHGQGTAPTDAQATPFEEDAHPLSLDQAGHWEELSDDIGQGHGHPSGQGRLSLE